MAALPVWALHLGTSARLPNRARAFNAPRSFLSPRAARVVIALAVLSATLLRFAGLSWGLPTQQRHYPLHPDEPIVALAVLRLDPLSLQLNPGMFNYGSLSLYLDRLVLDA